MCPNSKDNKSEVTQMTKLVFDRLENIVDKGENASYQHFLLLTHCFQQVSSSGSWKSRNCVLKDQIVNNGVGVPILKCCCCCFNQELATPEAFYENPSRVWEFYHYRREVMGSKEPNKVKLSLTHYQTTNFRLFQTERVCRRQFQIWRKWQEVIQTGRKHCGKRRNCS